MPQPRFSFVPVMDHELHVTEWGDPGNRPLIMWHGLARTGRDFDELARGLSDSYHVLCPDMIGRGLSTWSRNPEAEYSIEYYAGIASDLLDHYQIDKTDWIGTSMGGLIGMHMASGPLANRLCRFIINDIGPEIPQDAIDRILTYAGAPVDFATPSAAEAWLRAAYAPFGPASDAFWTRMARTSIRRQGNGSYTTHYDPRITVQFRASREELTTWDRFERISIPTHVIKGENSDILTDTIARRMIDLQPEIGMTTIPDCGHAPTLSRPDDIALVRTLLDSL